MAPKDINLHFEDIQSKTIMFLRFPLIVLVVLIHAKYIGAIVFKSGNIDSEYCILYNNISFLFSDILGSIAVPAFFFISGFLFFYHVDFSLSVYKRKIISRVKTILIPYLVWNLLVLFCYWGSEYLSIQMYPSEMKIISDFTIRDFLYSFWNTQLINPTLPSTGPMNPHFWYLRDLMIQMLFSPLIYCVIVKLNKIPIYVLGILFILDLFPKNVDGFSIQSILFFSWGSYLSINNKSIIIMPSYNLKLYSSIYILLIIFILYFKEKDWILYVQNINIIVGLVFFILVSAVKLKSAIWKVNSFLSDSSFFIYAFHELVLMFLIKLLSKFFLPSSDVELVIYYFLSSICVIILGLLIYNFIKLNCHSLNKILTGNR